MKKIILLFALISLMSLGDINAQCVPVPFPGPSLTNPDTSQGIPIACIGQIYDEVINVRVPADTVILGTTISVDSIGIDSISGIPNTFTYSTNSPNDYWLGGTYGCFTVQGNPTAADTGVYTMVMHAVIYIGHNAANTQLYDVEFEFIIEDCSGIGFEDIKTDQFVVQQNAPNPFTNETVISFHSPKSSAYTLDVYNIAGMLIRTEKIEAKTGVNQFVFTRENIAPGIYIYQLSDGVNSVRKRMIIQ